MTDQEVQLLKQVFESAGAIGSQGFEAMVRYTFVSGLAWLIGGGVVLVASITGMTWALSTNCDDGEIRGVVFGTCAFAGAIALLITMSNIVDVVEPEGATVRTILSEATP